MNIENKTAPYKQFLLDSETQMVEVIFDITQLNEKSTGMDFIQKSLEALAGLLNVKMEKKIQFSIKENDRLFYDNYYVGELVNGEPQIYYYLLQDAMAQGLVAQGLMESHEGGTYKFNDKVLTALGGVMAFTGQNKKESLNA